jgi:hypothetical protein
VKAGTKLHQSAVLQSLGKALGEPRDGSSDTSPVEYRFRIFESLNSQLKRPGVSANVCGVAGYDAVELIRIAGGLQQAFASAARAAIPEGVARGTSVERMDEGQGASTSYTSGTGLPSRFALK